MRLRTIIFAWLAASACGDNVPSEPTWTRDIAPILAANCVRCHSLPALGGAPDSFRLDAWDDTLTDDGRRVFGAGTMSEFLVARAERGQMPPRLELSDRQKDILLRWLERRDERGPAPAGPAQGDNRRPTMRLLTDLDAPLAGDQATLEYQVDDADGDLVYGELVLRSELDDVSVTRELHNGRGLVVFDPDQHRAGHYQLVAFLRDHPTTVTEVIVGAVDIEQTDGNVAPRLSFDRPRGPSALLSDADSPFPLTVVIDDPDATAALTLRVEAVRGPQSVVVAEGVAAVSGFNGLAWDLLEVPSGSGWTLVATANDGVAERSARFGPITIAHTSTDLRWSDVEPLFQAHCGGCHRGARSRVPGLTHDFREYDDHADGQGVFSRRSEIYYRVVLQANMPPTSAHALLDDSRAMTDEERLTIAEWLEAGAPQ